MTLPELRPGVRPLSVYMGVMEEPAAMESRGGAEVQEGGLPHRPAAPNSLAAALEAGGLSPSGAREAASGFHGVARTLVEMGLSPLSPVAGSFVPGRVELLGKHVDYAGGRSLLVAVEQGFSLLAGALGHQQPGIHVAAAHDGERLLWTGSHWGGSFPEQPSALGTQARWQVYPKTLLTRLESDFPDIMATARRQGVVVAFASSLPQAAGMSSSSAFLSALFMGILSGLPNGEGREVLEGFVSREQLAEYLSAVEGGRPTPAGGSAATPGVGTEGGSQDHLAILCARAHEVVQYRFLPPVEEGRAPWPGDWRLMVAYSGVRAEKVAGAKAGYNRLARQARQAGKLTTRSGRLGELLPLGPEAWRAASQLARSRTSREGEALAARITQFTTESGELVPAALKAVREVDAPQLGQVVGRSQLLAQEVLRNQVPETDFLVQQARALGASAASAFGAGFGGAVWALAPSSQSWGLNEPWRLAYHARFPRRAEESRFLDVCPGPPAFYLFGPPDAEAPSTR